MIDSNVRDFEYIEVNYPKQGGYRATYLIFSGLT